jgi:hypothetical protein
LRGRRDAELFVDFDGVAARAVNNFANTFDQGFEGEVAGRAMIFVEWHLKTAPAGLD